jgi:spermidine synthase
MGATLPVFGLVARQLRLSIATLYGINTLGAAAGALLAAFIVIPLAAVTHTIQLIASINLLVGITAIAFGRYKNLQPSQSAPPVYASLPFKPRTLSIIVFLTGFATFALEAALQSRQLDLETQSYAILNRITGKISK